VSGIPVATLSPVEVKFDRCVNALRVAVRDSFALATPDADQLATYLDAKASLEDQFGVDSAEVNAFDEVQGEALQVQINEGVEPAVDAIVPHVNRLCADGYGVTPPTPAPTSQPTAEEKVRTCSDAVQAVLRDELTYVDTDPDRVGGYQIIHDFGMASTEMRVYFDVVGVVMLTYQNQGKEAALAEVDRASAACAQAYRSAP